MPRIRVRATVNHIGLSAGDEALVDPNDPDVEALLSGGFLVDLSESQESAQDEPVPASDAPKVESSPKAHAKTHKATPASE